MGGMDDLLEVHFTTRFVRCSRRTRCPASAVQTNLFKVCWLCTGMFPSRVVYLLLAYS